MLDKTFLRPIAHRGLHRLPTGPIENSLSAFAAAIAGNYGIECDLQPASDGTPMVFHDDKLDRLTSARGPIAEMPAATVSRLKLGDTQERIPLFDDLLALVDGKVPVLVEIKSSWTPLPDRFLAGIAERAKAYRGPIALMSFDPVVMAEMRRRCPGIPRGIVSGIYHGADPEGWWSRQLTADRQERLTHLLESGDAAPDFYAYHVEALPTPVTRFVREVLGVPLFAWTVRSAGDRAIAAAHADVPIFEGFDA